MSPSHRDVDLRGADLTGRRFDGVSFAGARLDGATLRGARLVGCSLRGCDLEGADLRSALLDGCDLRQADLSRAKLSRATILDCAWDQGAFDGAALATTVFFPAAPAGAIGVVDAPAREAAGAFADAAHGLALGGAADEVRAAAERALAGAPWGAPLVVLAELAERARSFDEALEHHRRACALAPTDLVRRRSWARCLVDAGHAHDGAEMLEAILAARPDDVAVLRELGWAAHAAGDEERARTVLEEADRRLRTRGELDVDLWLQLASVEVAQGRPQAALARFRDALAAAPSRADLLAPYGELCEHIGAFEAAETAYATFLEAHPAHRAVWMRRAALLLARLGDADGALAAMARGEGAGGDAAPEVERSLAARRPQLLDEAYRFEDLAAVSRAGAAAGQPAWLRLHLRALTALGEEIAPWLDRATAPDVELRREVGLRRAPPEPSRPASPPAEPALPDALLADLLTAGLVDEAGPRAVALSPWGSLVVAGAGASEILLGPRQRALRDPRGAARAIALLGVPAWTAPLADGVFSDGGAGDDALSGLPRPLVVRFRAAAKAARARTGVGLVEARRRLDQASATAPATLAGPVELPGGIAIPARPAPRWLADLLALVAAVDSDREIVERYRVLPVEPSLAVAVREAAALPLLEAALVQWLLGPALIDASAITDGARLLGETAHALRAATVEAIGRRLDALARGLVAAALDR